MDISTLAAAIGIIKKMPDTAVTRAEKAASDAESAAELAQQYWYRVTVEGNTLVVGEDGGE